MSGKLLNVNLHFTWSTKGRRRLIDKQWRSRLHSYLASIAQSLNARLIEVQSEEDHIHLFISLPSTITIAALVNALKANSSRWIHENFPNRRFFAWQHGYAAFSVSKSMDATVIRYIRNQDEHHKKMDFRQELLALLKKHQIEFDERYIFD